MQNKSTDVLVLGAGIVGLSAALKLQERGRDVVLVDRAQAGAATSFGDKFLDAVIAAVLARLDKEYM